MKFNVGDRVRNVSTRPGVPNSNYGKTGTVTEIKSQEERPFLVTYDDGMEGQGWEDSYELIKSKKSFMKTLGTMMKKLLDADTQTLVKAGYINGDLELTAEGNAELMALVFDSNKAALVAAAQVKIDAEKAA